MNNKERWKQFNHKTEAISTVLVVIITLIIFAPDGLYLDDIIYSLIIGVSTLMMVFVLKYGLIWIVETIRALRDR